MPEAEWKKFYVLLNYVSDKTWGDTTNTQRVVLGAPPDDRRIYSKPEVLQLLYGQSPTIILEAWREWEEAQDEDTIRGKK